MSIIPGMTSYVCPKIALDLLIKIIIFKETVLAHGHCTVVNCCEINSADSTFSFENSIFEMRFASRRAEGVAFSEKLQ